LGSLCDDYIIGNSTFSWWTAWLGEKKESKVVRPFSNFDGLKSKELDDKDYFPERWIRFNHLDYKIKLDDVIFYINSSKGADILKNYILNFFDVKVEVNSLSFEDNKKVYVFNKDYFLPPILIYYTYLKLNGLKNGLVINNVIKIFKVSRKLNYSTFLLLNDFGIFSKIFSFDNRAGKKLHQDIYLKCNSDCEDNFGSELALDNFVIDCAAGQFCEIGGYSYNLGCFIKEKEIKIKKELKKILSIK
jgi:hypothetical protein